jgi:ribonuclease R
VHELPEPKRILEFEQLAATFGYTLGVDVPVRQLAQTQRRRDGSKVQHRTLVPEGKIDISPRHYQKLIKKLAGKPEERILSYLMLRSLKQARYSEINFGHFALATESYTHFTSPIRRYPDLIVHRILKHVLDRGPQSPYGDTAASGPLREGDLQVIGAETSQTERRAADAERSLIDWKKARFIEQRLGEEFDAIVTQITRSGLFVELLDLFVEGFVPVDSLGGGRFQYRESDRQMVNPKTKEKISIGNRMRVRADRMGDFNMKPEFSRVEQRKPAKAKKAIKTKKPARKA